MYTILSELDIQIFFMQIVIQVKLSRLWWMIRGESVLTLPVPSYLSAGNPLAESA